MMRRPRGMFRLEKQLEKAANNLYKKLMKAWLAKHPECKGMKPETPLKLNTMGHRSYMDRLYFGSRGRYELVEYKMPDKGLSDGQEFVHAYLKRLGFKPRVVDNIEDAKRILLALFEGDL